MDSPWLGVGVGVGIFIVTFLIVFIRTPPGDYSFEPTDGFFEKILMVYLDITKFVIGLAAGGIVLIVGSSALSSSKTRLPMGYAAPLFLLAMSVMYGVIVMPLLTLNYEAFTHKTTEYTRLRYVRNRAL
jgi:hypothetical protein